MSMSILIKGMEMPRKCIRCPVNVYGRCLVNDDKDVSKATADAVRDKDCPLVPVPEHGDLIDRDVLLDEQVPATLFPCGLDGKLEVHTNAVAVGDIMYAPTVIPAEKEN